MIGATEILIIGGVIFVLFGAGAIPKFAKSLGQAKREFQNGTRMQDDQAIEKGQSEKSTDGAQCSSH